MSRAIAALTALLTAQTGAASPVFVQAASMREPRVNHTATRLNDGTVFVVDGINQDGLAKDAEIFDPQTSSWSVTGSPVMPRHLHTATLLADGRVLIVGGIGRANLLVAEAEIYNPRTRLFRLAAKLNLPRYWHAAVRLGDGRVLIAGGYGVGKLIRAAEIYDPTTDSFVVVASLLYPRAGHVAFTLPNGNVLIAGGQGYDHLAVPSISIGQQAEVFDIRLRVFVETGGLRLYRPTCAALTLQDGRVVLFGGGENFALRTTEVYDPVSGMFVLLELGPNGLFGRRLDTATLLPDGRVVLIGGLGSRNQFDRILNTIEFFDPRSGLFESPQPFVETTAFMKDARQSHTATLLQDGRVLVVGGANRTGALSSVEVLTP